MEDKKQQMPKKYPFGEKAWQNYLKVIEGLKKQSPISREKAIQQAQMMREELEKQFCKNNQD